jgi:transposase
VGRVVIGMDPHKRSATIEVLDERERVLSRGAVRDGRRRLSAAGGGTRMAGPAVGGRGVPGGWPAFGAAAGRRWRAGGGRAGDELGAARTLAVNRLHRLLTELTPGGAKRFLSPDQAKALLAGVRPPGRGGPHPPAARRRTRRGNHPHRHEDQSGERAASRARARSGLLTLFGIGPSGAAPLLGDIGDVRRFSTREHFASWNGTAPIDASSGDQQHHRLSRAGDRRINRVLHMMAVVQLRHDTEGRAYYRRKLAAGKTPMEAMRALKRRLSNVVYRQLVADQQRRQQPSEAGPGGHMGSATGSSAAGCNPVAGTSEKSLPGPAEPNATPVEAPAVHRSSTGSRRPSLAPRRSRRQAQSA